MAVPRTLEGRVVDPVDGELTASVELDGGEIVAVEPRKPSSDAPYIFPGFVDLHVYDWAETAAYGVTGFLATCGTRPAAEVDSFLEFHPRDGSRLGVHLEGPFLNPDAAGAQPEEHIQPVDLAVLDAWLARGNVSLVTLAPEVDGGLDAIRAISGAGVIAGIGHTRANYYTTKAAIEVGARFATHLWNAMSGFTARVPGAIGTVLADERVIVGLNADGRHLHPVTEQLTVSLAGASRIAATSDLVPAPHERPEDGKLLGGDRIGAALVKRLAAYGLVEAATMTSLTPARALGLDDRGRIAPGYRADIAVLDGELAPLETIVGGANIWQS
ncbi:MAG: N-acetylglucosamine-6-phosphate deacetylase [Gaiellaceae bacterium]